MKIHSRKHPIEPNLKKILRKASIPSNLLAIKLRNVKCTARQRNRDVLQYLPIISKIIPPCLSSDLI